MPTVSYLLVSYSNFISEVTFHCIIFLLSAQSKWKKEFSTNYILYNCWQLWLDILANEALQFIYIKRLELHTEWLVVCIIRGILRLTLLEEKTKQEYDDILS